MAIEQQSKKRTVFILIGAMVGILLASLDSNVVGTAMPKIIGSLKGFDLYTWPTTAYLLTMTISMPLFGKMADVYGFKPIYLFGVSVFLLGSVLCGLSQSMMQFIFFRGMQGIGGAILISNTMAIIGLLFPPADRAKYGGFVSSASGLASLIGPSLGGVITDHTSWRWVFFINVPLSLLVIVIILFAFPSMVQKREKKKVDFAGTASLILGLVPMLLAFSMGGKNFAWNSVQIIGMFAFSAAMLVAFCLIERKAEDPIIPLTLFKNGVFNFSAIEMFLINSILMAAIIFIPLFLQGVKGSSASGSGIIITPMLVSLILGVVINGLIVSKTCKYKGMALLGFLIMGVSTLLLSFWNTKTGDAAAVAAMVVMGVGIGIVMAIFNVTAQNVFPDEQMGVVTSSIQFFGRMGQTMSSSILGALLSGLLSQRLQGLNYGKFPAKLAGQFKDISTLSSPDALAAIRAQIPATLLPAFEKLIAQIRLALSNSIHQIFIICLAIVIIALITALFMKEIPLSKTNRLRRGNSRT
jgi:EmrB/QacA subfamily drug resistance transporter